MKQYTKKIIVHYSSYSQPTERYSYTPAIGVESGIYGSEHCQGSC
jgi:hypothetical protein